MKRLSTVLLIVLTIVLSICSCSSNSAQSLEAINDTEAQSLDTLNGPDAYSLRWGTSLDDTMNAIQDETEYNEELNALIIDGDFIPFHGLTPIDLYLEFNDSDKLISATYLFEESVSLVLDSLEQDFNNTFQYSEEYDDYLMEGKNTVIQAFEDDFGAIIKYYEAKYFFDNYFYEGEDYENNDSTTTLESYEDEIRYIDPLNLIDYINTDIDGLIYDLKEDVDYTTKHISSDLEGYEDVSFTTYYFYPQFTFAGFNESDSVMIEMFVDDNPASNISSINYILAVSPSDDSVIVKLKDIEDFINDTYGIEPKSRWIVNWYKDYSSIDLTYDQWYKGIENGESATYNVSWNTEKNGLLLAVDINPEKDYYKISFMINDEIKD